MFWMDVWMNNLKKKKIPNILDCFCKEVFFVTNAIYTNDKKDEKKNSHYLWYLAIQVFLALVIKVLTFLSPTVLPPPQYSGAELNFVYSKYWKPT